jgi:hypothetical protein
VQPHAGRGTALARHAFEAAAQQATTRFSRNAPEIGRGRPRACSYLRGIHAAGSRVMTSERPHRSVSNTRLAARERRHPSAHALLTLLVLVGAALVASRADAAAPARNCQGTPARIPHAVPLSFLGRACRDDECAGHKAGFGWADRNGIADPRDCAEAEDPAFVEGCEAFAAATATAEQAGFSWARDNGLEDRCRCGGAGPRFEAGCEAFVTIAR